MPAGAQFSLDDLNNVLSETLTDDGAMMQLADATARYNAHRLRTTVDAWDDDPSMGSFVDGAVQTSAALSGYLLSNLEHGSESAGKQVDKRNKQFVELTSSVVGLIPTGGTFTSFLASRTRSAGKDAWMEDATGNEAAAGEEAFDDQQETLDNLQTAMAVALLDSPRVDDAAHQDFADSDYRGFTRGLLTPRRSTTPGPWTTFGAGFAPEEQATRSRGTSPISRRAMGGESGSGRAATDDVVPTGALWSGPVRRIDRRRRLHG